MSDDLVARLRHAWDERERQLDEDERVARAATVGPWEWGPSLGKITWALDGPAVPFGGRVLGTSDAGCPSSYDAEHIARHDPARVLAEVERGRRDIASKRAMLDEIASWLDVEDDFNEVQTSFRAEAEPMLRLLAEAEGLA